MRKHTITWAWALGILIAPLTGCVEDNALDIQLDDLTTSSQSTTNTTAPEFAGIDGTSDVNAVSFIAYWVPADDDETSAGQIAYNIYLSGTSGGQDFSISSLSTTGTTFKTISGLSQNSMYCVVVRAKDSSGNEDSNVQEICQTTLVDSSAPSFSGVVGASLNQTSPPAISLSWSAANDDNSAQSAITYNVYRSQTPGGQNFAAPLDSVSGQNTYVDASVQNNSIYHYVVRAQDESGNEGTNTTEISIATPYDSTGTTYAYHPGLHDLGRMGSAVALLDWNADGMFDAAVGAYNTGNPAVTGTSTYRAGQVSIYLGLANGLFARDPSVQFYSPNAIINGFFGHSLAACDITGDGTADDLMAGADGERRVYIYLNTAGGQDTTPDRVISAPTGQGDVDNFGWSLDCGNFNGTGGDDLVIAAPLSDDNGAANSGTLFFYNNNSVPPVVNIDGPNSSYFIYPQDDFVTQIPDNNQPYCGMGLVLADLDGGGTIDLAVGCPLADLAGANDGVLVFYTRPDRTDSNTWVTAGFAAAPNNDDYWGWSLAYGNTDASDGSGELVIGQTLYDSPGVNAGALFIHDVSFGAGVFSLSPSLREISDRGPNGSYAEFAASLDIADVDGDGADDLLVGAPNEDFQFQSNNLSADLGAVYFFRGSAGAVLDANPEQSDFNTYLKSDGSPVYGGAFDMRFGRAACAGDINNDDRADLLVSAENDPTDGKQSAASGTGRVYVWYGVATGEIDFASPPDDFFPAPGLVVGKRFGSSCLVMDYDRDGLNDVVIGSQYADDNANDQGAVYIYLGVASANLGGADTGTVPVDGTPDLTLFSPETPAIASNYFGSAVAACDLTGDGFEELIVGARQFDGGIAVSTSTRGSTNEGAVFIFRGTVSGVDPSLYQVIFPTDLNVGVSSFGTAAYSDNNFGYAVGCFPTVGGSAGMDLIVGAPFAAKPGGNANQGMTAAFFGAVNEDPAVGPASCSGNDEYVGTDCMIDDTRDIRIDDQGPITNDDSLFGSAISVGDWNGLDGADLVIGAYRARGPSPAPNNNGGVFAFRGAVGGGFMDIAGGVPLSTLSLLDPTGFTNNNFADGGLAFVDLNNNSRDEMVIGVSQCTYDDSVTKQRGSASGCIFVDRGNR